MDTTGQNDFAEETTHSEQRRTVIKAAWSVPAVIAFGGLTDFGGGASRDGGDGQYCSDSWDGEHDGEHECDDEWDDEWDD